MISVDVETVIEEFVTTKKLSVMNVNTALGSIDDASTEVADSNAVLLPPP